MSREIETSLSDYLVSEFWGGEDHGKCLQITDKREADYIIFDMTEASKLISVLGEFVYREAKRRQSLLAEELKALKVNERLVFHEVSDLDESLFRVGQMSVDIIDKFCPKSGRMS